MAKQTFTTGQVLTAAQMTSLQQTAMLGGSATAKTASYVLVAADAGTTVAMSAAGATTITVNTGLFAAGDTVFIQNRGAGACTVTAGTATVATAGSLILPQNDAGILYFTATGAATFYDFIQAGAASPLTTKGDLYTFSTSDARLPVGTNNYVLTADSAEATGLKWAAAAGGGGGKVLQVVNATYSTQVSTSTNTYVDTGLTASITPSLVSSKVLVFVSQSSVGKSVANAGTYGALKLLRGSTDLVNFETQFAFTNTAIEQGVAAASTTYLDSPATTSSTTYKTQVKSAGNTSAVLVQQGTSTSTITLMEIGA
jgi:hypothetical protein